jgi:PAS domain S-box-containing protein
MDARSEVITRYLTTDRESEPVRARCVYVLPWYSVTRNKEGPTELCCMPTVDYKEIFEKAEVGIALNNPETGTVGTVNERYATLMGYRADELKEMTIEEISADDPSFDQDAAMEKIQQALAGDRHQFDWLFERKDGSRFWGEVVLKRTMIGPQDRLLAFVRDISDRKQYERELKQQNQRLNEFASIVSHDLQNPLTVANGHLELAQQECESDRLTAVARAHTRMETLIDDLLTLARAGDTIGDITAVDLPDLVESCWQNVETDAAELHIEAGSTVSADRRRLQQLLENLLANSVDHGGDEVTITVDTLSNGFYIEDDGPGIPESERETVFKAGFSTAEEGTGFGLSIVRETAEAHGWDISVTEGSNGGARFEITDVEFVE